jgi:hypothetical protein
VRIASVILGYGTAYAMNAAGTRLLNVGFLFALAWNLVLTSAAPCVHPPALDTGGGRFNLP